MTSYAATTATLSRTIQAREQTLPLKQEACRSRFFFHPQPTAKVCLFFHGFTAAPYQFVPMAEALYRAGHNVLIPLMPGHGRAGDWCQETPPPLPQDVEVYQRFALAWLRQAQTLGRQVVVGGLSGGGTLAAWLALNQPQAIARTLLFAPYLSSSKKVIDLFVRTSERYFEWVSPALSSHNKPSYDGFSVPALRVFLNLGNQVLQQAKQGTAAPMFTISSESDRAVENRDHFALFERALERQPLCWYHRFDRVLDIPHTMMTTAEGNAYERLLIVMAKAYIESNLTWAEVEEIGYRMAQGRTFNAVVAELGLGQKVSPDMPAMMTMVDKRAIVIARNAGRRRDR